MWKAVATCHCSSCADKDMREPEFGDDDDGKMVKEKFEDFDKEKKDVFEAFEKLSIAKSNFEFSRN